MTEQVQETEVSERATRRRFTAEYKRGVLREADGCAQRGELGAQPYAQDHCRTEVRE